MPSADPFTLSEADSKAFLAPFGVPFAAERLVDSADAAGQVAAELGFPVVAKLCGASISHKTERGLVRLGLRDEPAVEAAAQSLLDAATPKDGPVQVLVAPMVSGNRELIAGLAEDPQFTMTVMVGIGGVFAEAVADVAIRLVPITRRDAHEMLDDLATQRLLGEFRGEPPVDREAVVDALMALSAASQATPDLVAVDLNPMIICEGRPVAVDALVEMR